MDCKVNFWAHLCRTRFGQDLASDCRRGREGRLRPWPLLFVGLWVLVVLPPSAESAELVMFEAPFCEWCEVWDDEVGMIYHMTSEGRLAPLRRVPIHEPRPADLTPIASVRYSPTFVLLNEGHEVGRIVGYPGEDHFWGLLQVLLDDLPQSSGPEPLGDM
jgi:hypothetical protein